MYVMCAIGHRNLASVFMEQQFRSVCRKSRGMSLATGYVWDILLVVPML